MDPIDLLYIEQKQLLDLLAVEASAISTISASFSRDHVVEFLHSAEGRKITAQVSDASDAALRREFDRLVDELKGKDDELRRISLKTNKLRQALNMKIIPVIETITCLHESAPPVDDRPESPADDDDQSASTAAANSTGEVKLAAVQEPIGQTTAGFDESGNAGKSCSEREQSPVVNSLVHAAAPLGHTAAPFVHPLPFVHTVCARCSHRVRECSRPALCR